MTIQPDDLISLLTGIGGTAGLMRLLQWRTDRRLARAQTADAEASASQRITEAAATLVEQTGSLLPGLTAQVAELRAQVVAQGDELTRVRTDSSRLWGWLEGHQAWDMKAIEAIRSLGGHLDPPEPPPARQPAAAATP